MREDDPHMPPFAILTDAAPLVNKVRISILRGRDLNFRHQDISCHDHEYGVINL